MSDQPEDGFKVEFKKSGVTATWNPAVENILELAEDAGISADSSCQSGTCHTCLVRVLSGTFEYEYEDVFEPDGEDEILICSAQPTSNMVIDL